VSDDTTHQPPYEQKNDTNQVLGHLLGYVWAGTGAVAFVVALVMRIVSVVALVVVPYSVGRAINVLQEQGSRDDLAGWSITALVAGAVYLVLSIVAERIFARLATNALMRLQTGLFDHMQTLSLGFFDRQPIGQLLSRVTNDTEAVAQFYETVVSALIKSVFQVLVVVVFMFAIDWRLALAALVVVPIMLVATSVTERVSTPAFAKMQEQLGELGGFQEETISGQEVIVSNRRHEWAMDENEVLADGVFDVASKAWFSSVVQFPLTVSLTILQVAIVLLVGSVLVIDGQANLGDVVSFVGFVSLLATPLSEISNLVSTTLAGAAGARRVFAILDEQPSVVDAPNATDYRFEGGHVQFEDVDFSYVPGRKILKHNTFEALPGQKVGICGPTGAGKSTIINLLTRYYDIDSGTILIDGQNIADLTQESLRRQVGTVLQEPFLFSDTVMSNLKYARDGATDEECVAAAKEANAHEFITKLPQGYDTMLSERGANLAAGERQMLTIARAMVAQPKLLVLDEATSNVDTRTERLIQEGLQRLMEGRTSFVIAHRLATIRDAAQVLVVNGGEIAERGTHEELMADRGLYYALYMSQFKGKAPGGGAADTDAFVST
jgi:ATP-binding cassette subfamily B protein